MWARPRLAWATSIALRVRSTAPHWIEDHLGIDCVEPAALWFDGGIGPVKVQTKGSDLARPGWAVTITLAKVAGEWRIFEVGNVYP